MSHAAPTVLGQRRFDANDQQAFARLSGDTNPIHMDPVAARRSVVGDVVVHGVHTILWALEMLAKSPACPVALKSLDVRFPKPVYLGDEVVLRLQGGDASDLRLTAVVGEKTVASMRLGCAMLPQVAGLVEDGALAPVSEPEDIAFSDLATARGEAPFAVTADAFAAAFPAAAACFGAPLLRELAATSRLVGMQCPGLRSIFSRVTLTWEQCGPSKPLIYHVTQADARFSMVNIAVEGASVRGAIEAFSPPPPPPQMILGDLRQYVGPQDFANQTALIIGGSRGLGELTAKAIAAGGGRVLITYSVGREDAQRVVDEISQSGGKARCFAYDATKPPREQLANLGSDDPSHVYYFATCQIFRAKTLAFDSALLDRFMTFYVRGYHALCEALWDRGSRGVTLFYPSSIAVEDRPKGMTEYAMAKASGEILTSDLPGLFPGYRSHHLQLPRLMTDQTAVVSAQNLPAAIDILLPTYLAMRSA